MIYFYTDMKYNSGRIPNLVWEIKSKTFLVWNKRGQPHSHASFQADFRSQIMNISWVRQRNYRQIYDAFHWTYMIKGIRYSAGNRLKIDITKRKVRHQARRGQLQNNLFIKSTVSIFEYILNCFNYLDLVFIVLNTESWEVGYINVYVVNIKY